MKAIVSVLLLLGACSTQSPPTGVTRKAVQEEPRGLPSAESSEASTPVPAASSPTNPISTTPPSPEEAGFGGSKIFLPAALPAPAILLLHGSEGGREINFLEDQAKEFAKAGFVAMSFCWFDCVGAPKAIHNVSLERTVKAMEWLKQIPQVGGKKVGLFGWSRGAEQAVLIASLVQATGTLPAVAVNAPSDTIVLALDIDTQAPIMEKDPTTGAQRTAAAWTWKNQPIYGEKDPNSFGTGPAIEIQKYAGPLYISHGKQDDLWPYTRSQNLEKKRAMVPGLLTEAHYWEGEGYCLAK